MESFFQKHLSFVQEREFDEVPPDENSPLMRAGLSKPQIQNMTNLSRVTIWRWVKKYDWVMTLDDAAEDSQAD